MCESQLSSCHAPLLQRPPTQNVDYGACASVSWPCMCVSARFEGLLQRVCVSQQSSCSSSHGPPFSPLASPPFTALASRESAQSTRRAWRGKTHAWGGYDRTYNTARGLRRGCWCAQYALGRRSGLPHGVSGRPGGWRWRGGAVVVVSSEDSLLSISTGVYYASFIPSLYSPHLSPSGRPFHSCVCSAGLKWLAYVTVLRPMLMLAGGTAIFDFLTSPTC